MRILNVTAVAICLVLALATAARSELFSGAVHFTDGEVADADKIHAMKSKELKARFVTHEGGRVQFEEMAAIDFSGETDFRGGFKFVITTRDGERIPGWIRSGKDFGYMWEITISGKDAVYKLNQGVQAESIREIEKIVFE